MRTLIASAATLCLAVPSYAQTTAQLTEGLTLGAGIHYSTGDYGTGRDTDILFVPVTARWDRDRLTVRVTVPWIEISGSGSVVPGLGTVPNPNPTGRGRRGGGAADTSASGLGDTTLAATWALLRNPAGYGIDITGKAKVATADEDEGLGTGEHDFGVFAEGFRTIERTTWFAGIGHTWMGSSAQYPLRDVWSVNLGASYRIDERDSAGLAFDTRQAVTASSEPQRELMAFFQRRFDRRWSGQAYFLKGLSDGSPDWGAGVTAAYAF
jgi:hypothetical protein